MGKLGVSKFNPVLFALIREMVAGPILVAIALFLEGAPKIKLKDLWMFALSGFFVFANQFGFIVGEKLSNAVIGSAWQPSQPIMTVTIAIFLGWESATPFKLLGIFIAFGGAAFMVFYGQHFSSSSTGLLAGNILFFLNCLGTALYVITTKPLINTYKYPPITVTGFSYIFGSLFMAVTAVTINTVPGGVKFVCPVDENTEEVFRCGHHYCSCDTWTVPDNAWIPLAYWIVFNSVLAYFLLTWGNRYADASKVLGYTALQPLTSALVSLIIITIAGKSKYPDLKEPGMNGLGGVGIVFGLLFIMYDNHLQKVKTDKPGEDSVCDELIPEEGRSRKQGA
ncbi:hypothetical protein CYMTET_4237 [Cymbomonas tetramitiformis]|uniref:EamA domain-containing protein n=1 Tax=Cymbomonas tetramitiformis TaxID=36881 RepID=A0AAE0H1Q1_9CHLO|nr:hypothetical protein CYMTET_4237 [Cymbomonas tetramitiformis]